MEAIGENVPLIFIGPPFKCGLAGPPVQSTRSVAILLPPNIFISDACGIRTEIYYRLKHKFCDDVSSASLMQQYHSTEPGPSSPHQSFARNYPRQSSGPSSSRLDHSKYTNGVKGFAEECGYICSRGSVPYRKRS